MILNINTNAVVAFTNKLEKTHRAALPNAVRNTLNKTAFDVKTKTMPATAKQTFIQRKPTFFKANSKVKPATGFSLTSMKATVGFIPKSDAVKDLEQQEHGGAIGGRAFVPLKHARSGKAWNKMVRARMRMSAIANNIVDSNDAQGKNDKSRFVKSAVHAKKGGFVIGNRRAGKGRILHYINSVKRVKGGNTVINSTPVYSVLKGRKVTPKATKFMNRATMLSVRGMERTFIDEAKKQIARY